MEGLGWLLQRNTATSKLNSRNLHWKMRPGPKLGFGVPYVNSFSLNGTIMKQKFILLKFSLVT